MSLRGWRRAQRLRGRGSGAAAPALRHAIGGLAATINDSMAVCAPTANSYRRFQPEAYVPLNPSWSVNNRGVAFRVPHGPPRTAASSTASRGPRRTPTCSRRWCSAACTSASRASSTRARCWPATHTATRRRPSRSPGRSALTAFEQQRLRPRVPRRALHAALRPDPARRNAGLQLLCVATRVFLVPDDELSHGAHPLRTTPHPRTPPRCASALEGRPVGDVCVVGGGIAGCSTALHLAERGYSVVLLEGKRIGWGASGRSGGQALFGFAAGQDKLVAQVGRDAAQAHVRRLGRGARPAEGSRRAACDRLRPELGPDARRDQAAARDGAARAGARNSQRDYGYAIAALARPRRGARDARDASATSAACSILAAATCIRSTTRSAWRAPPKRAGVRIFEGSQVVRLEHGDTVTIATTPRDGAREACRALLQRLCRRKDLGEAARADHAGRHLHRRDRAARRRRA